MIHNQWSTKLMTVFSVKDKSMSAYLKLIMELLLAFEKFGLAQIRRSEMLTSMLFRSCQVARIPNCSQLSQ